MCGRKKQKQKHQMRIVGGSVVQPVSFILFLNFILLKLIIFKEHISMDGSLHPSISSNKQYSS